MADRYDALTPKDLVITLRSLPRRFGAVAGPTRSDPGLFARIDEPGPDGRSLGSIVSHVARRLGVLATEIEHLLNQAEPTISGRALTADAPATTGPERLGLEEATASIERSAEALAHLLDRQDADTWARQAPVDSGGTIDVVTLVQATAREAIEALRAAEQQLDRLRPT